MQLICSSYYPLFFFWACQTNTLDPEERKTSIEIINSKNKIPGIQFLIKSEIDTIALNKEFQRVYVSDSRKRKLIQTLEVKEMLKRNSENTSYESIKTFFFNEDSLAIITNGSEEKTYSLIKTKKDSIFFYWTNKKGDRFFRNRQINSTTDLPGVKFKIEPNIRDRKYIKGFDCYKMKITVSTDNQLQDETHIGVYDCYVTDEILNFSAYFHYADAIFPPIFPKINECALEIIKTESSYPHSSTSITALKIEQTSLSIFEVPESLKTAVRYYNTKHHDFFDEQTSQMLDSLECHGIY